MFVEIPREDMPKLDPEKYPDYYTLGQYDLGERVFKDGDSYLEISKIDDVGYVSMISAKGNFNIFSIKSKIDELLKEYGKLGFFWKDGIRNEVFIRRLLKNYKKTDEYAEEDYITVIFEEVVNG